MRVRECVIASKNFSLKRLTRKELGSGEPEWIAQEIGFAIPRQFKRHPAVNE